MQYGRGMKATSLTLYRDRSILRKSSRQAIKISRKTKTFFLAIVISLFRAARARSLFYHIQGRTPEGNVIFRVVNAEQKRSMENGKEIKWRAITSAKLIRCTKCTREDIPGWSLGTHIPSVLVFSAARELFSNPSTLIDNPVERADLDRATDEDFLPRGTGFCGGSLCSGERNNFYLMLKNVLQDIAPSRYIISRSIIFLLTRSSEEISYLDESADYIEIII